MTANKALLAEDGPTPVAEAAKAERDPSRESVAGDKITWVLGLVNGQTNCILAKMEVVRDVTAVMPVEGGHE